MRPQLDPAALDHTAGLFVDDLAVYLLLAEGGPLILLKLLEELGAQIGAVVIGRAAHDDPSRFGLGELPDDLDRCRG